MATLTRTRSVLDLGCATPGCQCPVAPPDGMVSYVQTDEDTGAITRSLLLPTTSWQDMGQPAQITITVEPGDRLNG